jgi:hypothetical protein
MGIQAFVHIIESPSAADLLTDQIEGRALCGALQIARIPHRYNLASNLETFRLALSERLIQAIHEFESDRRKPILHLSMHGNEQGVGLTDSSFLSWSDLQRELQPLLNAMQGGLLICMSSCFGSSGCRIAMHDSKDHPFWALVGNSSSVEWSDAAIAYITFYHHFFKGRDIDHCVMNMRVASGDNNFSQLSGYAAKKTWADASSGFRSIPTGVPMTGGLLGSAPTIERG